MARTGQAVNSDQRVASTSASEAGLHPALVLNYRKPGQNLTDAAAQAEWANKRWVWVTDLTLGYVAGWIVSEQDDTVQVACVDDRVSFLDSSA